MHDTKGCFPAENFYSLKILSFFFEVNGRLQNKKNFAIAQAEIGFEACLPQLEDHKNTVAAHL
jgi:hypothetical protein